MVLCLKARESRSLPSLPNAKTFPINDKVVGFAAGWSSPVARQAHNLKVVGSNPAPATNSKNRLRKRAVFCCSRQEETHVLHHHAPHRHRRRPPHRHARLQVPPPPWPSLHRRGD